MKKLIFIFLVSSTLFCCTKEITDLRISDGYASWTIRDRNTLDISGTDYEFRERFFGEGTLETKKYKIIKAEYVTVETKTVEAKMSNIKEINRIYSFKINGTKYVEKPFTRRY